MSRPSPSAIRAMRPSDDLDEDEIVADAPASRWGRFLNIYRTIRIPWVLMLANLALGLLAAQIVVWLAPFSARINRGDFTSETLVPAFVGVTIAQIVVRLGTGLTETFASFTVVRRVQDAVWHRMLGAPLATYDRHDGSEMVSRVTNDPQSTYLPVSAFFGFWTSAWGFTAAVLAMARANGPLSLRFLVIAPVAILTFWAVGRTQMVMQRLIMRALGTMTGFFTEHLGAFAPLKAVAAPSHEEAAGITAINARFRAGVIAALLSSVQTLLGQVVTTSSTLIVFIVGAGLVRSGDLAQPDLVLYNSLAGAALPFLFEILTQYQNIKGTQGYTEKLSRVLLLRQEDTAAGEETPHGDLGLDLRDVSLSYGDHRVLDHVSLTIPAGCTTVVVGPNGSGKSTLLKVIQRVYEPDEGELALNGVPSGRISLSAWRKAVSTVAQEPTLISGTVGQAIAFADPEAAPELIRTAAATAQADGFIRAEPDGYELQVGEGGANLSGGQRQRVAIARSLLPGPRVLLLDEATSALDPATARAVGDADAQPGTASEEE